MAALQAVAGLGVPVVFVTGRPARWMAEVAERTGHTGLAICANGAVLYDLHTEQIVEHDPIPVEVGLEVARLLRAALPDIAFAVETLDGFAHEPTYLARWDAGRSWRSRRWRRSTTGPALKLLARHEAMDPDALLAAAREVVGEVVSLTHSSSTGAAGDLGGGGVEGERAGQVRGRARDRRGRRGRRSATCPTTCRCWRGPGRRTPSTGGHPEVLAAVDRVRARAGGRRRGARAGAALRPLAGGGRLVVRRRTVR